MARTLTWREQSLAEAEERGCIERTSTKLDYRLSQDTLRHVQIRSLLEDQRIEREAVDGCRDPWDLIQG